MMGGMDTHAVYIRLHRRRGYWRVAVIFPHSIRWRCYRQADCPTPDDVLTRVREGLSTSDDSPDELDNPAETRKATRTAGTTSPTIPMIPPMISPGVTIYLLPIMPTTHAAPAAVQKPNSMTTNRASRSKGKTPRSQ